LIKIIKVEIKMMLKEKKEYEVT